MKDYELYIWWSKVDFIENYGSWTLNDRLYVYSTRLQTHFEPININDWENKAIELKIKFSNIKENLQIILWKKVEKLSL